MQRHSPLAIAALAGLVAAGSLAATLSVTSPALADDHHGNVANRDRGAAARDHREDSRARDRFVERRDDQRGYAPAYVYQQQPAYGYAPAYAYPAYVAPSSGFVRVAGPGFSLGIGF